MIQGHRVILAFAIATLPLLAGCTSYGSTSPAGSNSAPTRMYVSDGITTNGTVYFNNLPVTPTSLAMGTFTTPNLANSMCVDASGRLFVTQASNSGNNILAYAQPILNMAAPTFSIALGAGANSIGCVFDSSGNLYVSLSSNKVAVIAPPVTMTSTPSSFIVSGISFPGDVTVDSSGDVFVCNLGSITEYSALAMGNTLLHTFGGVFSPSGCAIGPDSNLYVANGTKDGEIDVYRAPFSNASPVDHTITPPTAVNIWDIKFDAQTNMYVAGDSTTGSDVWVYASPYSGAPSVLLNVYPSGNQARGLALAQ